MSQLDWLDITMLLCLNTSGNVYQASRNDSHSPRRE